MAANCSIFITKLRGYAGVSLYIIAAYSLQVSTESDCLDQPPVSAATFLGENTTFYCSIRDINGDILWFVNNMYALSGPPEYGTSLMGSSTARCINSTLQIRAIEQTNNSQIQCAVAINGELNRTYFSSTALLQVQGPPLPPPNLQGSVINAEALTIELTWEEPSSLINCSIINYNIKLNISLETFEYLFYENTTTETSLGYTINQDGIHLCNISSVTVNVHAQNKVGIGEAAKKTILPNIELCTSSSVVIPYSSSMAVMVTPVPTSTPGLKMTTPTSDINNRILIYGCVGGVVAFLFLIMTTAVTITSVHLFKKRKEREPKVHVSPNEAYADIQLQLNNLKPDEVHIYEELGGATKNHYRGTVITITNEAYACTEHSSQTY